MLRLVLSAAIIALASACCMPEQFEAQVGMAMGSFNHVSKKGSHVEGSINLSMDFTNKIVGEDQMLVIDGGITRQYIVMDYNQGIAYIERNGACNKYHLQPMQERCWPEENTQIMNYGLGKNFVNGRGYNFNLNGTKIYMSVTADTCAPIAIDLLMDSAQMYQVTFLAYSNVTTGIKSRRVFNVPTSCAQAGPIRPMITMMNLGRRSVMGF